jgi:FAD/FMN-containing dehydrogenase
MTGSSRATVILNTTQVDAAALRAFRQGMQGAVLDQRSSGYDEARRIWNAMIDRRPALIAQCATAADVARAIGFARDNKLKVTVRGGGHNIAGSAVCDDGLMIDLSPMKSVRVDASSKRAWIEPGATLADVDRETQAFRLALPTGVNSTTGISGLTLGGGFGWLTRKYGLTIDSLLSADVVTADGALLRASAADNEELFWALRGGGGNFGVVTAFEFQLSTLAPQVFSGLVVHPLANAEAVLKQFRGLVETAPDELSSLAVMRRAPPLPFLPVEWHGKEVLVLAMCYCGDMQAAEQATAGLCSIGTPLALAVGPNTFLDWQQTFDPLLTPGARNYWKSHDLIDLSDGAIESLVMAIGRLPGPECEVFIAHIGGAASRVSADATAFPQRTSHFVMNIHARWREPAMDQACIGWARRLFDEIGPHAAGTAYVNFMPSDEGSRVESAYGTNYVRLAAAKQKYDPQNVFSMNANIKPWHGPPGRPAIGG